jgi:hypothetical protein
MYVIKYNAPISVVPASTTDNITHNKNHEKWVAFTCTGKETTFMTKLFKNHNIKIAFCIRSILKKLLCHKRSEKSPYDKGGVYKLKCQN